MVRLSLSLLGPFQAILDGKPITSFESNKARALLAYLAVNADQPHHRDVLAGLLWPDRPDRVARSSLRHALSNLRYVIGDRTVSRDQTRSGDGSRSDDRNAAPAAYGAPPFLSIARETIRLNQASSYWLDVEAFGELADAEATNRSPIAQLEEAISLYRGDFLEGFSLKDSPPFEDWLLVVRERLGRQASTTLHRLVEAYEKLGEYERACQYAWRQVELEPWREEGHRQLMRLLALSGQRGAALAQYDTCCRTLEQELGVEPAEETTALYEQIRDGTFRSADKKTSPHNLPVPMTPIVGREGELDEIRDRLQSPTFRLLTLVGPGGIGKTRLALEAAAQQIDAYPHGVYFVPLATVRSADGIVSAVARALGFPFREHIQDDPRRQLLNYLREKRLLLVLDGLEHLVDAGTEWVSELLGMSPGVKIVVTSRSRLSVRGEHLFPVAGLDLPERVDADPARLESIASVQLFLHSARQCRRGFQPEAEDWRHIAEICRRVQGMPLAILLTASWIGTLEPKEILDELSTSVLDFLQASWRDVPEQQSMRAVFDRSWRLLTEREQGAFSALSVFRASFTRQAAQHVAGVTLQDLRTMADKSLLHRTFAHSGMLGSGGRYEIHALLRAFAGEKLAQSPVVCQETHNRHCEYFVVALAGWADALKGADQQDTLAEMDVEIENARAAWDWAVEQARIEQIDRAIEGLCRFYEWRGRYAEGAALCQATADRLRSRASDSVLASPSRLVERVLGKVLAWQATFCRGMGRVKLVIPLLQESLDLLARVALDGQNVQSESAFTLFQMGRCTVDSDLTNSDELYRQSLALYRSQDDRWGTATALDGLGWTAFFAGNYDMAEERHRESLAIRQVLGDKRGLASSLGGLSATLLRQGRVEESSRWLQENIAVCREIGDRFGLADALNNLGMQLIGLGNCEEALQALEESLANYQYIGFPAGLTHTNLGIARMHLGQYDRAQDHVQTGLSVSREMGYRGEVGVALFVQSFLASARGSYAEAQQLSQESIAIFQQTEQPYGLGQAQSSLAYANLRSGQLDRAQWHFRHALQIAVEIHDMVSLITAIPGIALLLAEQGKVELAVEIHALASRYAGIANSRWFEDVVGQRITAVVAASPKEMVTTAQQSGQARDLETTVGELLVELRR